MDRCTLLVRLGLATLTPAGTAETTPLLLALMSRLENRMEELGIGSLYSADLLMAEWIERILDPSIAPNRSSSLSLWLMRELDLWLGILSSGGRADNHARAKNRH